MATLSPAQGDYPAVDAAPVTPDDSNDLAAPCRGLYIGGGGDVTVRTPGGNDVTFVAMAGGAVHPIRAKRVWATGTTATDIVALY